MEQSILKTIKKLIGVYAEYNYYDTDFIVHINTVFAILNQIGIGTSDVFFITGEDELWSDFLENDTMLQPVIDYMYIRVKLLFDTPSSSTLSESLKNTLSELEWRLFEYSNDLKK